jgi:hypothetical protein
MILIDRFLKMFGWNKWIKLLNLKRLSEQLGPLTQFVWAMQSIGLNMAGISCVVATINILAFSRSFYLIQDGLMSLSHSICCIVYSQTYCSWTIYPETNSPVIVWLVLFLFFVILMGCGCGPFLGWENNSTKFRPNDLECGASAFRIIHYIRA